MFGGCSWREHHIVDEHLVTKMAKNMVTKYGMSTELGTIAYGENEEEVFLGRSVTKQQNMSEETAKKIAREMKTSGLISLNDLHSYHVLERQVLKGQYKDLVLHLMPPPSAGGILIMQVLKILEEFQKKRL